MCLGELIWYHTDWAVSNGKAPVKYMHCDTNANVPGGHSHTSGTLLQTL